MKLLYLMVLGSREGFRYERLAQLAKEMGHELYWIRQESNEPDAMFTAWKRLRAAIDEADAFFLPDDTVLLVDGFAEQLHKRVQAGARLLISVDENCLDRQNAFLSKYDLVGTRVRIRSATSHLVRLERSPERFRDVRLFAGVEEIHAQQPNAIWYGGQSLPMLVADDRYLAIDGLTDLPIDWNLRELACAAAWHGLERGGVLALAGGYFRDPYEGPTGVRWPNIDLNEQFAKNVLHYLSEGRAADTAEDLCKRVEINLADFVLNLLRGSRPDWWEAYVPENIREKCNLRRQQQRNLHAPEAYLDLIDLKTLMEKNWDLFSAHLEAVLSCPSKNRCLDWLTKLNTLRTYIGHPLKKHVAGYDFSADDHLLLREADGVAIRLRERLPSRKPTG